MASESTAKVVEEKAPSAVPKDRRYVGSKETFAYILDDIAQSFNIGKYDDVFKMNILKIDLVLQSITNGIISVWDIINDIFLAAIVDKTRTRWGKFKPWLVIYAIPGVFLTVVYWALPIFMGTEGIGSNIPRFAIYLILQIFSNLAGSLIAIVRQGMTSTITPNIIDRTRLITSANLLSGFVGEKLPELTFGLLLDLVNNNVLKWNRTHLFMWFGIGSAVVSCAISLSLLKPIEHSPLLLSFAGAMPASCKNPNYYYISLYFVGKCLSTEQGFRIASHFALITNCSP